MSPFQKRSDGEPPSYDGGVGAGPAPPYGNPGMNFSQPRVGYDPENPRSIHSEYYECDPLEGYDPDASVYSGADSGRHYHTPPQSHHHSSQPHSQSHSPAPPPASSGASNVPHDPASVGRKSRRIRPPRDLDGEYRMRRQQATQSFVVHSELPSMYSNNSHMFYPQIGMSPPEPLSPVGALSNENFSNGHLGVPGDHLGGLGSREALIDSKYNDRNFDPPRYQLARGGYPSIYLPNEKDVNSGYVLHSVLNPYMAPSATSLPLGTKYDSGSDLLNDLLRQQEEEKKRKSPWHRLFGRAVEEKGIERVPEDERSNRHLPGLVLLWWSVNLVLSSFPIGLLGPVMFGLTFRMAVTASVIFTAIGAAFCAYIATLGPQTGLRSIVISRYAVGYVGGAIFGVLNILTQLGFSCTAVILGGQTLARVSSNKIPLEAAIFVVGFMALLLCFVGYQAVHYWNRVAWVVQLAFFICMLVLGSQEGYDLSARSAFQPRNKAFAASFLSYGGIVFSSAAGWAPIAADFNCRLPANTSRWLVFALTWFGLMLPLVFVETLSSALMTVRVYRAAFEQGDVGGALDRIFWPWHQGGKAIMGIMAFSIVANVAPNTYSAALSAQTLLPWFKKVPRAAWCVVMFIAYTAAAIGGREHFSVVLSNFLSILGYWVAFFVVVIFEEVTIFRRRIGWNLNAYDSIRELPVGVAGIVACVCGAGGAIIGMAQEWYTGPLAALFGKTGGDLGFEMSAVVTALVYPPLRWLEIRCFGR